MSASTFIFGATASATYAYAAFTSSDARFREGQVVPYAPRVVLREDMYLHGEVTKLGASSSSG
ncbi:hypothetical protein LVJ94_48560 [Pendulispora rubella]|uniref:Uncharacterized protein n=1 Tax=Pendulispora rubella TaxID=2741070 RepID=A0ABZ2L324_9BACT